MPNILMPALSPTMEEGKLAKWLKKVGDSVKSGDVIAEIETDKATMEVEAVDEGKLTQILVPEGAENVKVNTPIAVILGEGEAPPAPANKAEAKTEAKAPSALWRAWRNLSRAAASLAISMCGGSPLRLKEELTIPASSSFAKTLC